MTQNAFIFCWDEYGIESIVPITKYEEWDQDQTAAVLKGQSALNNPVSRILWAIKIRAQINSHRQYECYAVDCEEELNEKFWRQQWLDHPQETADLIRQRGVKIFSHRRGRNIVIT